MRKYKVYPNKKQNIPELNRVWFQVLHMTADISATDVVKRGREISKRKSENICAGTLRNLRNGKTTYPTLRTAFIISRAMGRPLSFGGNEPG